MRGLARGLPIPTKTALLQLLVLKQQRRASEQQPWASKLQLWASEQPLQRVAAQWARQTAAEPGQGEPWEAPGDPGQHALPFLALGSGQQHSLEAGLEQGCLRRAEGLPPKECWPQVWSWRQLWGSVGRLQVWGTALSLLGTQLVLPVGTWGGRSEGPALLRPLGCLQRDRGNQDSSTEAEIPPRLRCQQG